MQFQELLDLYTIVLLFHHRITLGKAISQLCVVDGLPQPTLVLDEQKENSYASFMMGEVS